MSRLFVLLQYLLPHHGLSRLAGSIASRGWLQHNMMRWFIRHYRVDLEEAELSSVEEFDHFNAFFTRALKPVARPLVRTPGAILCPADGAVSAIGTITQQRLMQAKGQQYSTTQLLADQALASRFDGGSFVTIYLSPRDYHRVHMPVAGKLVETRYLPGRLFSVNRATARNVPALFARNERLVCRFKTPAGTMVVVLVGAMIVAAIETVWAGRICPNRIRTVKVTDYRTHLPPVQLAAGAELGRFSLGSTVIVLFEPGSVSLAPGLTVDSTVKMGQLLATRTAAASHQQH